MLCYSPQRKQEPRTNKQLTRADIVWVAELYCQTRGTACFSLGVCGKTHAECKEVVLRRDRHHRVQNPKQRKAEVRLLGESGNEF